MTAHVPRTAVLARASLRCQRFWPRLHTRQAVHRSYKMYCLSLERGTVGESSPHGTVGTIPSTTAREDQRPTQESLDSREV